MFVENVGEILQNTLRRTRLEKRLNEITIFLRYEDMVGENIAEISRPTFIRNGILFIGVKNHIWMHELYMLKLELMDKINSHLPSPIIKDIKFQICDIKGTKKAKADIREKKDINYEIPEKIMDFVYNICQDIDDEDLREKFKLLMIKDIKFKMKRGEILVHTHRQ